MLICFFAGVFTMICPHEWLIFIVNVGIRYIDPTA